MKTSEGIRIVGIAVLAIIWIGLAWLFLSTKGITLYNLLILAMTGIIIFLPLYKKYYPKDSDTPNRKDGKE